MRNLTRETVVRRVGHLVLFLFMCIEEAPLSEALLTVRAPSFSSRTLEVIPSAIVAPAADNNAVVVRSSRPESFVFRKNQLVSLAAASRAPSETTSGRNRKPNDNDNDDNNEEEQLSDVDTRVLQSMLQDSKLDLLQNEDDVRKLLERGTVKKVAPPPASVVTNEEDESGYASTVIKTLADTKLWKKFSAQAVDALETVGIWVGNKVEQDLKTLVALGLFGWERAVRDVARALPETRTRAKKTIMQLTNSSSFQDVGADKEESSDRTGRNVADEMNRPSDEIKAVSREIMGILSGQQRSSSGRGLRTAAPSGFRNSAERQRRAYQQKRKVERQEKDVTRVPGSVVDSAWELRRELKAETNKPGYKTKPIRNAIEAGVTGTGNLLKSVREQAKLSAAQRKEERRLKQAREESLPKFSSMNNLMTALKEERQRVSALLSASIEDPASTWLRQDVIDGSTEDVVFDEKHLRGVVEKMVLLRSQIRDQEDRGSEYTAEDLLRSLQAFKAGVDEICSQATVSLSASLAGDIREQLIGFDRSQEELPLVLMLDGSVDLSQLLLETSPDLPNQAEFRVDEDSSTRGTEPDVSTGFFASPQDTVDSASSAQRFVDVMPEIVVRPEQHSESSRGVEDDAVVSASTADDVGFRVVGAEVVSDDDFHTALDGREASVALDEEEEEEDEELNPAAKLALRSLDIVFFVVEKVMITGVPRTIVALSTATTRVKAVNQNGMGSSGWQQISKLADTKGRY